MILCIGTTPVLQRTLVLEQLRIDAVNRAIEVSEHASGKGINVARVLHALGDEALVTGFLGGDSGNFIRQDLSAAGIAHDFVAVAPKTRMCITVMDKQSSEATELVEESKQVETEAWDQLADKINSLLPRAKMVVLSGSLPPGALQDFYHECVARAAAANVNTIVDASGEPLRRALAARPMVVKPNRSELAKTLDATIDSDAALRDCVKRLIALGPMWAVITEGKAGAIVSDGDRFWRIRSPQVKAINPIGSGDALAAGIASALSRGQQMPDAVRLGIACGAANAMTPLAGIVHPADVAALLPRIEVESW